MNPAALVAPYSRTEVAGEVDSVPMTIAEVAAVDREATEADRQAVDKEAGREVDIGVAGKEVVDILQEVDPNPEPGYKDFEDNLAAADKAGAEVVEGQQNKIRNSRRPGLHMKPDYYN